MKIVDAVWEKRNLGVATIEITVEEGDPVSEVIAAINGVDAQYAVVRVPASRPELIFPVQQNGFIFSEEMVHLVSDLSKVALSPIEQRLWDAVTCEQMTAEDISELYAEIRKGLFSTDRIYLDPAFSNDLAAERYINWINDELERGGILVKYVYKGKTAGFYTLRETSAGDYTSALGGMYSDFRKGGLVTAISAKVPEYVRKLGGRSVDACVSTNNPVQIRNLLRNGYRFMSVNHVFTRHSPSVSEGV